MKHIIGRFNLQPNKDFPIDTECLDSMQTNIDLTAVLGNIAGDKVILSGCEAQNNGNQSLPGYVFVRTKDYPTGEVLFWEGGSTTSGMCLRKEQIAINAYGYQYQQAYIERSLVPGVGDENFKWADFSIVSIPALNLEIAELYKKLDVIKPAPLGIVEIFAGQALPENYLYCEGQLLKRSEYASLFQILGTRFNSSYDSDGRQYSTPSDSFRLPDLRGRFIVGNHSSDPEYNQLGRVGGEKKHQLTVDEMPKHSHSIFLRNSGTRFTGGGRADELDSGSGNTSEVGGEAPHENRPPYYSLAYIIKVK